MSLTEEAGNGTSQTAQVLDGSSKPRPGCEQARPPKPNALQVLAENIPAELQALARWGLWRYKWDANKTKWDKPPLKCDGKPASTTTPGDWAEHALALAAFKRGRFDGLGFVLLSGDGIVGVDIDGCRDSGTGEIEPEALSIARAFNSYAEVSPSGSGIRIFLFGQLPGKGRRVAAPWKNGTGKADIEIYDRGRYLTVTGQRIPETPRTVEPRQEKLEAALAKYFPQAAAPRAAPPRPTMPERLDDTQVLERALRAKNGAKFGALWNGDLSGYDDDHSRADMALCCHLAGWTRDTAQIERMWLDSGLRREKLERADYRANTIARALALVPEWTDWSQNEGFVGFVGSSSKESAQNEPQFDAPPRALTINLRPVPALSPELLPGRLRDWVADIAERQSVPYEFPAVAAIVALASLVGRKIGIRPKQHDDWTVTPNLWGALVGPPGLQKTPAAEEGLKPVRRLAAEALERHKVKSSDFKAETFLNSVVSEQSKNNLKAAVKSGKASAEELRNLSQKAVAEDDTPAPTCRRYMVNDATLEALCVVLQENPNGVLVQRDELTAFLRTLDKPGHESDRGFYLEAWNGTGDFMIDRIGRGIGIYLPAVCVSLLGTIQPGPLARYIRGASGGEGADGLVQRFQLMVYPNPTPYKLVDRFADTQAKNCAFDLFRLLDDINPAAVGAQVEEGHPIPFLRFAPDAQILFNEWRHELETEKLRSDESPVIEAHLSKYRSLMPSLALLFHLIESVEEGRAEPVTLRAAKMAAAWCDFLEEHARRIYQSAFDGDPEPAMRLAERIRLQLPNPCRVRDIIRRGWEGLTKAEDVERALGLLEEAGWLKIVETLPEKGIGRPNRLVYFNPLAMGSTQAKGAK
jgi:hypothetical protein